jgi:ring-1,2-phenylacetyl-CoA epoxidase subunit PaaB
VTPDSQWPLWEVFVQEEGGAAHVHAGSVHAPDGAMAVQSARDVYARRAKVASIWVVESNAIVATSPEERSVVLDSVGDKAYRHPQFYKVPRGLKGF